MRLRLLLLGATFPFLSQPCAAQSVEEVRTARPDTPTLPEDLFRLPPGAWAFARQLWTGDDPCTAEECEAGYNSGDLVVSVERNKTYLRIIAGFRGCVSVAWNEYEIGNKASSSDRSTVRNHIKKTVRTSAKYCKLPAPTVAEFDARQLYPVPPAPPSGGG